MKKAELVAQLETAKVLSSQVDIDKVIELINKLDDVKTVTTLSEELINELSNEIERVLDHNSYDDLVDKDSAEFSIGYNNTIELDSIGVNIYEIMNHVNAVLQQFEDVKEDIIEDDIVELERGEETAE
jgi:translation elongation factor EF-Tu-like GTPase